MKLICELERGNGVCMCVCVGGGGSNISVMQYGVSVLQGKAGWKLMVLMCKATVST